MNPVETWVERYIKVWNSNDPQEIGDLFTDDATYFTSPFAEPWRGRAEIVREWLARKDTPGSFTFRYEVLATDPGSEEVLVRVTARDIKNEAAEEEVSPRNHRGPVDGNGRGNRREQGPGRPPEGRGPDRGRDR